LLLTQWNNVKELPELLQRRGQYYFIEGTDRSLKDRYPNDLAEGKIEEKVFSLKSASEHACIIN
jgi:hypothetical protein